MSQTAKSSSLPPLVDRELFFGNPEIAAVHLSPDGQYMAFLRPWNGTLNVWAKKTSEPFTSAHLLTTEKKRPIGGFFFSRDSKQILYVKDNDGDENFNVYSVSPAAPAPAGADAPPSRDLTGVKGVRVQIYSVPRADPDNIYIGLNDRDKSWHDLYKVRLSTGERTLVRKNTEKIAAWIFDEKGQLRLAMRTTDTGDTEILRVDQDKFTTVYSCGVFESCGPERFHKDDKRVYMITNKGDADLISLVLFDPQTKKVEPVESDPLKRVDLEAAMFSETSGELLVTRYVDDKPRRYFHDKALEADYKLA